MFIDSLFTETATSFPIPDFNKSIFICRSNHFVKCFKKAALKVLIYPRSSLLENLYSDHKLLRHEAYANHSIDDRLSSTSRKRVWYILKMSWKRVNKNILIWSHILTYYYYYYFYYYYYCYYYYYHLFRTKKLVFRSHIYNVKL